MYCLSTPGRMFKSHEGKVLILFTGLYPEQQKYLALNEYWLIEFMSWASEAVSLIGYKIYLTSYSKNGRLEPFDFSFIVLDIVSHGH